MRKTIFLTTVSTLMLGAAGANAQAGDGAAAPDGATPAIAAQDASGATPKGPHPDSEIVVTGTRSAISNAENFKRHSSVLVDGISADDIGALPDVSMADALVRVPGLTANNSVLGFDQVSIRGLGPDLTQVQYDGRVLPTPSPTNRRLSASVLPTEGIAGAYVQKTPEAATIEGGTAGTIDLESIHPLETSRHGLTLVGRATTDDLVTKLHGVYGWHPVGFRGEATYVGRPTDRLGIAISYAYLQQTNLQPSTYFDTWKTNPLTGNRSDLNGDGVADALPGNASNYMDYVNLKRHSVIGMVQWKPTDSLKISVDGLVVISDLDLGPIRYLAQGSAATTAGIGQPTSVTVQNSTVTQFQGNVSLYRTNYNRIEWGQRQYEGGLNLAYDNGGPVTFAVDGSYARASQRAKTAAVSVDNAGNTVAQQITPFGYNISDLDNVTLNFQPYGPNQRDVSSITTADNLGVDTIKSLRTDFKFRIHLPGISSIAVGAKIDGRNKNYNSYGTTNSWALGSRPVLDSNYLAASSNPINNISQYLGGDSATSYPLYDLDKLLQLNNLKPATVSTVANIGNYSRVSETTFALYAQANIDAGPLTGNVGVRWFNTDEKVKGFSATTDKSGNVTAITPVTAPSNYHFLLPALNLRYAITRTLDVRFGASETVSRPVYSNLKVGTALDLSTVTGSTVAISVGNPYLKPFSSKNIDISAEWYPDRATSLAIQGYYKWVSNFTTNTTTSYPLTLANGQVVTANATSTTNDPTVRHFRGIEIIARRDFNFLPGFLSNTGLQVNYNHNLTDAYDLATPVNGVKVKILPNNFQRDVVNTQLYYSTKNLDVRLAYRWYNKYPLGLTDYQYTPGGQLDVSTSFKIWKNIRFTGYIRNVTKSRDIRYYPDYRDPGNRLLLDQVLYSGRSFTGGIRATF